MALTKITVNQLGADSVTTAKIADDVELGGNPTTTTQSAGNNSTRIATTAYTEAAITALTSGAALNEYIADTVGAMVGSNTESGITVAYQDGDNTLDFTVGTLNQDTSGTAATVTGGTQAAITSAANLVTVGTIGTGTWQGTAINQTYLVGQSGTNTGDQTSVSGNAGTATALATARTIGGVSFDGSANINLPGVNAAGNQNTSGTAANLSGTPNISVGTIGSGNITTTGYIRGPSSFTIDPATHGDDTGTLVIAGNLQVDGTTTTINSTTVAIDDLNFSIATDAANSAAANGAGITIGGASATLLYTHATTSWDMNKPLNVTGNIGVSGTVTSTGTSVFASLDISGDIDVDGTTNLDIVDIDGAVDMASTLAVGGVVKTERGSAGAPPYTFKDDLDTGMFNISNADLGFSVGGTERLRIESGGIIKSSGPLHINPDGDISKDTFRLTSNASYDAALLMNSNTTLKVSIQANASSYFNGGNVGIGIAAPAANLHVFSSGQAIARVEGANQYYSGLMIRNNYSSVQSQWHVAAAGGTSGWGATNGNFIIRDDTTNSTGIEIEKGAGGTSGALYIDSDGNVGIATTPDDGWNSNFDVLQIGLSGVLYGYHANAQEVMCVGNNFNNVGASFVTADRINTGFAQQYLQDHAGQHVFRTAVSAAANSSVSWVDAMTIDNAGSVGIGTATISSPFKLQVKGTPGSLSGASANGQVLYLQGPTTTANEGVGMRFSAASGSHEAVGIIGAVNNASGNSGSLAFHVYNGGSTMPEQMRITNDGTVGIGTTGPAHKLSIGKAGSSIHLGYNGTAANYEVGRITSNSYDVDNTSYSLAEMNFMTTSANGYTGEILFRTNSVNSTNSRAAERLRIGTAGQIGIGGANYGTDGQVLTSTGTGSAPAWEDAGGGGGYTAWAIKTSNYTAVASDQLICNSSSEFTISLPGSPSAGHTVIIASAGTGGVVIGRNGSNINSAAENGTLPQGNSVQLVYVDGTIGWFEV